jgi:hypothetical protein
MKVYDHYEISPCQRHEEPGLPGHFYFEACDPEEADVWTLYGHLPGEGVEAIGNFATREEAEQVYSRITGLQFTGSYQANAQLRAMHAAPELLVEASAALLARIDNITTEEFSRGGDRFEREALRAAIAEATGNAPPEPRKPIVIEVRGGVVQEVRNVPPGYEYEIVDHDDREADDAGRPA